VYWLKYSFSFCFVIFCLGLLLAIFEVFVSFRSFDSLSPGVFVVLSGLSFVFWFGVIVLLYAVLFGFGFLRKFSSFLLVFFIWLTFEGLFVNPWFSDVYFYGAGVVDFLRGGGGVFAHGHESPGFLIVWSVFCLVSGFDVWFLMKWFRLLFYIFTSVLVYCIFRKLDKEGFAGFSVLFFMSFYWAHQDHFCRQAFAFMLYCVGCLISSKIFVRGGNKSFRKVFSWIFLFGVVLLCLFFVHPLTPVVLGVNFLFWFSFLGFGSFFVRVFLVFLFSGFMWFLMDFLKLSILGYVFRVWNVVSAKGVEFLFYVFSFGFLEVFSPSYRFIVVLKIFLGFLETILIFICVLFYVFVKGCRNVSGRFLLLWIVSNCFVFPLVFFGVSGVYDRFFIFVGLPLALTLPFSFSFLRVGGRVVKVFGRFLLLFAVFGLLFCSFLVKFSIVSFYHPSSSEIEVYRYVICFYGDSRRVIVPDKDVPQFMFFAVKYNSSIRASKFIWFSRVPADQVYRYAGLIVFSPRLYAFPYFYVDASLAVESLEKASLLVGSNRVFDAGNTYLVYLMS